MLRTLPVSGSEPTYRPDGGGDDRVDGEVRTAQVFVAVLGRVQVHLTGHLHLPPGTEGAEQRCGTP